MQAVKNMDSAENLAQYEVPQALLQIIQAYSYNGELDQYTGFVMNLDRTAIRVGRAVVSQSYVEGLQKSFYDWWDAFLPLAPIWASRPGGS